MMHIYQSFKRKGALLAMQLAQPCSSQLLGKCAAAVAVPAPPFDRVVSSPARARLRSVRIELRSGGARRRFRTRLSSQRLEARSQAAAQRAESP